MNLKKQNDTTKDKPLDLTKTFGFAGAIFNAYYKPLNDSKPKPNIKNTK